MATRRVAPRPADAKERTSDADNRAARAPDLPADWVRPVVSLLWPVVDDGRRPAKAAVGDTVSVEAEAFAEGHDVLTCDLLFRPESAPNWSSLPMVAQVNDIWRGEFPVTMMGQYRFAVYAKVDRFLTWRRDLRARIDAGQDVTLELLVGAELIDAAAKRATSTAQRLLSLVAADLWTGVKGVDGDVSEEVASGTGASTLIELVFSDILGRLMDRFCDPSHSTTSEVYTVVADRERARFSTWYEMFPRSASTDPDRHGTFADVRAKLPYVAHMGFDVLYLPPIHPIGRTGRKGRDGATHAAAGDPGSPWAIGAAEGGHTSVHPELGTIGGIRGARDRSRGTGHRRGDRPRVPGLTRSSLGHGASGLVPPPPRREHPLRREPPETVRGHLPARFRDRRLAGALGRTARRRALLGRAGASRCSGWTTRTPSPSPSGSG